jgi:hypothetical protein
MPVREAARVANGVATELWTAKAESLLTAAGRPQESQGAPTTGCVVAGNAAPKSSAQRKTVQEREMANPATRRRRTLLAKTEASLPVYQAHMLRNTRHQFQSPRMIAGDHAQLRVTPWWSSGRIHMSAHQWMTRQPLQMAGHLRKCVFGPIRLRDLVAAAAHIRVAAPL